MKTETVTKFAGVGPCSEGGFLRTRVVAHERFSVSYEYIVRGGDYEDWHEFERTVNPCAEPLWVSYRPVICLVGDEAVEWLHNESIPF